MNSVTTSISNQADFPIAISREGVSDIFVPKISLTSVTPPMNPAFYNMLGRSKRDVMVHVVSSYATNFKAGIRFADVLAGVGAGGIRVANESRNVEHVFMNDLNPNALRLASMSAERNSIGDRCSNSREEANFFLAKHSFRDERFDFVDVDPFGCPTSYLESALRATKIGGILGVTSTDGQVLCGIYPNVSLRKYGGYSLNADYCHEIAIRLMLGSAAFAASRLNLGISPVFVHNEKHYTKIYAMVTNRASDVEGNMGYISQCVSCPTRTIAPVMLGICPRCRSKCKPAGPLWIGDLYDKGIVTKGAVGSRQELARMFLVANEEIGLPATFYVTDSISRLIGCSSVPLAYVLQSLEEVGHKSTRTILDRNGFRTEAGVDDIIAIFLSYKG